MKKKPKPDPEEDPEDLFSLAAGKAARDEGIERVVDNTPLYYRSALHVAFWYLVERGWPFTGEDARRLCGDPPNHHNAFGGLWFGLASRALEEGYIVQLPWLSKARRKTSHARGLRVYVATGWDAGVQVDFVFPD